MKKLIRLTEGDLHKIVRNAVKKVIKESNYPNPMGRSEDRINAYPEYDDGDGFWIPNTPRLHTLDRTTDHFENCDDAYYDDGELYPSADWAGTEEYLPKWGEDGLNYLNNLEIQDFKNKMKDYKDRQKYSKQADSRRLWRKGALNGAFDED